jgi:putative hydrolase of the HAD superfamily
MLRVALLDLDDTLYAADNGLWGAIGQRINRYMIERLRLPVEAVPALRRQYFERFGATLNGLRAEHNVDTRDYLAFVHAVPLEDYLQPNPALDAMLARLPHEKVIFTNADAAHARRVIERLGIARHFSTIVDIEALDFISKPDPRAYDRALALLGARAAECVFADDGARNLAPARALGMLTVLVDAAQPPAVSGVDLVIPSILDLEAALVRAGRLPEAA